MPNITEFVDVSISVQGKVLQGFNFGSLIGVFTQDVDLNRQSGPYETIEDLEAAGFTAAAAPEVHYWATSVFSQSPSINSVTVGRRVPSTGGDAMQVWQFDASGPTYVDQTDEFNSSAVADWDIFPAVDAIGDAAIFMAPEPFSKLTLDSTGGTAGTVGVVAWEYWDGSAWTALTGVVDGTSSFTAAVSAGQVVSWTLPVNMAPVVINGSTLGYAVRARITTVYTINPVYDSGTLGGDASWDATMTAIQSANPNGFYFVNIESRVKADILAVAAWVTARSQDYFFNAQSSDSDFLNGVASNVGEELQTSGYKKVALWYHATDSGSADGYLDGAVSSRCGAFDLDAPAGVGVWAFKSLEGVTLDTITTAQSNAIYGVNGNMYALTETVVFTSKGTTAYGAPYFIDVATTLAWTKKRSQESILNSMVSTQTKIPYTNGGFNLIATAIQSPQDTGVSAGHYSPDILPTISYLKIKDIPVADKQARIARFQATFVFAGAIQKVVLTIAASF